MALLQVGLVARAHGLGGEVVVDLSSDRVERVAPGSVLVVRPSRGTEATERTLTVVASRPFQRRWLVRFADVTTREQAEAVHGAALFATAIEDDDALFVHELIGTVLVDQHGIERGRVTAVEANPASDLLVVDDRYYVPARFVISTTPDTVHVDVPDGLFDDQ